MQNPSRWLLHIVRISIRNTKIKVDGRRLLDKIKFSTLSPLLSDLHICMKGIQTTNDVKMQRKRCQRWFWNSLMSDWSCSWLSGYNGSGFSVHIFLIALVHQLFFFSCYNFPSFLFYRRCREQGQHVPEKGFVANTEKYLSPPPGVRWKVCCSCWYMHVQNFADCIISSNTDRLLWTKMIWFKYLKNQ